MTYQRAIRRPMKAVATQRREEGATHLLSAAPAAAPLPRFTIGNLPVYPPGLPERLKSGIEALSGVSMDRVRVHYNSPHPARIGALAYARGREIHLARGEEKHLPHEAWHLVQQAQGRVTPNLQLGGGVPVNDDRGLEREADRMGEKAQGGRKSAPPLDQASLQLEYGAPLNNGAELKPEADVMGRGRIAMGSVAERRAL